MASAIENIMERISALEEELEAAFSERRSAIAYHLERRRIVFEADLARHHRELKTRLLAYVSGARLSVIATAPFIYAVLFPLVLLDLFVTIYQAVCFPVYRIEKVRRRDFMVFDRHHLAYLNGIEKLNCTYCSYANGLIAYVHEIASRTEQYWCPIKHSRRITGAHRRYPGFFDFGDAEGFRERSMDMRKTLAKPPHR